MKYKAVIFDLFGTLIDNFSFEEYRQTLVQMASALSAPPDAFADLWFDLFEERMSGALESPVGVIGHICRELSVLPDDEQIKRATSIRLGMTTNMISVRPDAVQVMIFAHQVSQGAGSTSIRKLIPCSFHTPSLLFAFTRKT